MIIACFCGAIIKGAKPTVCPKCLAPIEFPTLKNPSGLPQNPENN